MKKLILGLAIICGMFVVARTAIFICDVQQLHSGVSAYSSNVDYDLNKNNSDNLSVQVVYSSATYTNTNFTNGLVSWTTLTISSCGTNLAGKSITVNGVTLTAGVNFSTGSSTSIEAMNIRDAINASSLAGVVISSHVANLITASATVAGVNAYAVTSSTTGWVWTASTFQNGLASDINLANNTISTTNVYATGLPVLFSSVTGTAPVPLVSRTTYYVTVPTATSFKLSDTSTGAAASIVIDITTQTQTGKGTFTIAPIGILGSFVIQLQCSNDGVNFQNVILSTGGIANTVTFATPWAASNAFWNLGRTCYRYLRIAFTKGTWGAINLSSYLNLKNYK